MRVLTLILVFLIIFEISALFGKGQLSQLVAEGKIEEAKNHILMKFSKRISSSQKQEQEIDSAIDKYLFVKTFKILFKNLPQDDIQRNADIENRYSQILIFFQLTPTSEKIPTLEARKKLLIEISKKFLNLNNYLTVFGIRNLATPELVECSVDYFQGIGEKPIANLNNLRDPRAIEKIIKSAWDLWSNNDLLQNSISTIKSEE
ncbi:hypothetical protein Bealeia1_00081 [Candidatus Bealeia paramacronuclearis]|uniref:Uncharacterized protein n=1 Tax=Candidatus Bealeia paramacronuclearis TaxID=1921001 RepID=A0ABZ2C291_9PROT|nr:hypothetical protein [Candidatus Bealeia paramacronuclearis]